MVGNKTLIQDVNHFRESGVLSLIGADDTEVSAGGDYSNSASFSVAIHVAGENRAVSGEVHSFALYSTESGTGALQYGKGSLIFFDADPAISAGDTTMTGAEAKTVFGIVNVDLEDWKADTNGAICFLRDLKIPFHALSTLYVVYKNEDGAAVWNSAAGDDEALDINVWTQSAVI